MSDLVKRASEYATSAHQRINHRRKYNKQPYHVHLEAVAGLVASVCDDQEMIAAAWLHDTVEDTPATFHRPLGSPDSPSAPAQWRRFSSLVTAAS